MLIVHVMWCRMLVINRYTIWVGGCIDSCSANTSVFLVCVAVDIRDSNIRGMTLSPSTARY
jgi:hypothetical protein